jgi:hypothetical protein
MQALPHHNELTDYQGARLTPDTVAALVEAQRLIEAEGWVWDLFGPRGVLNPRDQRSLVPAGREVQLRLRKPGATDLAALEALWGFLLPLGFQSQQSYPEIRTPDLGGHWVFYFPGPWAEVYRKLLEGGNNPYQAWSSICAAAQVDVGMWRGDRSAERLIQAHLHLLGVDVGLVDGVLEAATAQALETLGVDHRRPQRVENLVAAVLALKPSQAGTKDQAEAKSRRKKKGNP